MVSLRQTCKVRVYVNSCVSLFAQRTCGSDLTYELEKVDRLNELASIIMYFIRRLNADCLYKFIQPMASSIRGSRLLPSSRVPRKYPITVRSKIESYFMHSILTARTVIERLDRVLGSFRMSSFHLAFLSGIRQELFDWERGMQD